MGSKTRDRTIRTDKRIASADKNIENKLLAFDMRFKGHNYAEISAATKFTVYTLQSYFYKNGDWYEEYQSWSKDRIDDINDQMTKMFVAQAVEANQMIVNLAHGYCTIQVEGPDGKKHRVPMDVKDSTTLRAAQDILDRAGYKTVDKVEVLDPNSKAEEIAKWFEGKSKPPAKAKPRTKQGAGGDE